MKNKRRQLIELRHLRYFITLAEELHFARAAERLQIEQSPLSRAIREMERLLGVRLFERNTRSTRITRAGNVLVDYARRVLALMEQAGASARSAALGHSNHLRIGVSDCTAYFGVTEILTRHRTLHPDVSISLHEMPLHRQVSGIRDDLLDASFSLDGSHRNGIQAQAVACDAICAIIPIAHPLARVDVALAADLVYHPLILFSAESDLGAGSEIENFAETLGRPYIAFRANSLGTMLTLVALGHGIGLVGSAQMAGLRRSDVVLRPIGGITQQLTTYVLHSNCGVSEPLETFIELARELCPIAASPGWPS
ncbi:LysR family transcriptional regulator [Caenimonas soli]|uniref:LysR family transcriptional regulator n=1 Tax=Caenimonas soli TaxID=2735555 RepID=UPI001552F0F1|nr:LysR substrate-binding domain-containing protein [Caenimonas soli]NPC57776.1 LysR family transcriptional regulator [Caenimonas soli]